MDRVIVYVPAVSVLFWKETAEESNPRQKIKFHTCLHYTSQVTALGKEEFDQWTLYFKMLKFLQSCKISLI